MARRALMLGLLPWFREGIGFSRNSDFVEYFLLLLFKCIIELPMNFETRQDYCLGVKQISA
jgi:hypothetical protein